MSSSDLTAKDEKRKRVYLWLTDSWEKLWCVPAWDPRCFATSTFHHKGHRNSTIHWNSEEGPQGWREAQRLVSVLIEHLPHRAPIMAIFYLRSPSVEKPKVTAHWVCGPKGAATTHSKTRGSLSRPPPAYHSRTHFCLEKSFLLLLHVMA